MASTIANDVVMQEVLTIGVIFAGLVGAIAWDLITFYLGLPDQPSHALVGGMAGAAVAVAGFDVLVSEGIRKIALFIVLSPLIGLAVGLILTVVIAWAFHRVKRLDLLNTGFRRGQLCRRPPSASVTEPTMPRRRWASSSPCSSPPITCRRVPTSRCGSSCRPTRPSVSAPSPAAGAS